MSALDEIVRTIIAEYDAGNEEDAALASLMRKIRDGKATYADVEKLASRTGTRAGQLIADQLSEISVDGRVTEEQAQALLMGPTKRNYEVVSGAAADVQENLNKKSGLGLKAVRPEFDRDRVEGLIREVTEKEDVPAFGKTLTQQVENVSVATVDDSVKANASAHYNAGLSPKIERITDGNCCKWCSALAGTYDYYKVNNTGNDVFRRHTNCGCQVIYDPGNGAKRQNAHTKRLLPADEYAKMKARQAAGLEADAKTLEQRVAEADRMINVGLRSGIASKDLIEPHAPPEYVGKIDFYNQNQVSQTIEEFERNAADLPIETAIVVQTDGNVYRCFGVKDAVYPDNDLGEQIRGAIISHNHPKETTEYSFSKSDRQLYFKYELKCLRGTDHLYTYQMNSEISNVDAFPEDSWDFKNVRHAINIRDAKAYGFGYRRWEK